jgi:hypothetical protein
MSDLHNTRLPLNSPQTFLPERQLLSRLLAFAAQGGSGNKLEISDQTGIPTGTSTGKVEPMLYYAAGMGLLQISQQDDHWTPRLTALGQCIYREDRFLNEPQTLWLLHLLLCRPQAHADSNKGIADAWFSAFSTHELRFGSVISSAGLHQVLNERHGELGYLKSLASVVLRMYQEPSCWASSKILLDTSTPEHFERSAAPNERSYYPFYTTYFYLMWDLLFPEDTQIPLPLFAQLSASFKVLNWNSNTINQWLDWLVDEGWIQQDKHTGSAMLLRLKTTPQAIQQTYQGLL